MQGPPRRLKLGSWQRTTANKVGRNGKRATSCDTFSILVTLSAGRLLATRIIGQELCRCNLLSQHLLKPRCTSKRKYGGSICGSSSDEVREEACFAWSCADAEGLARAR